MTATTDARCRIEMLGSLRVIQGAREITRFRTQKTASLLAYLACHLQHAHPREVLIESFWPDATPEAGRTSLRVALNSLRNQLEPPGTPVGSVLMADRASVGLNPAAVTTDVGEMEGALRRAARAANDEERARYLAAAVETYRGELLPGCYDEWALREQRRLAESYFRALDALGKHLERAGDLERALAYTRRGVSMDALREEPRAALLRLYAAIGQRTEGLREYHEWAARLRAELDSAPSPATERLARRLLEAEPQSQAGASLPITRPLPSSCPAPAPEPPTGTVTFLCLGIEADTGSAPPDEQTERLRHLVAEHGGQEVRESSGALRAVFGRASDALACVVECQRALLPAAGAPCVRAGLHTGEVGPPATESHSTGSDLAEALFAAARGGQILCSETTAALARSEAASSLPLRDLGLFRLPRIEAPLRLFRAEPLEPSSHEFPAPEAEPALTGSLPLELTRFFGREQEAARLADLLAAGRARLVTLTGPGGNGKTRLALEVARRLALAFQGRIWFVPLADVRDARLIPSELLDALRLPRTAGVNPLELAARALADRPALLVLDNFEQVVEGGAEIVQALLQQVPTLSCLVTSRRRLNLGGEQEVLLSPLPTPSASVGCDTEAGTLPARALTPEALQTCPSVQLFVDRAQAARADFQLTASQAAPIAELCERLEGVPLALELAAARIQVLPPAQMLRQLDRRLDLLVSRRRDLPERHRTLRATLDWSYALLAPDLRRLFARLAVFRAGWMLDAAEAIDSALLPAKTPPRPSPSQGEGVPSGSPPPYEGGGRGEAAPLSHSVGEGPGVRAEESVSALLDRLEALVESSLVVVEEAEGEIRYRMLETVRQYAWEKLAESGALEEIWTRHLRYYLQLAEEAAPHLQGPESRLWQRRLAAEHGNLLAALEGCFEQPAQGAASPDPLPAEAALRLVTALWRFWEARGYWKEGRRWIETALRAEDGPPALRIRALNAAGVLAYLQSDYDDARELFARSLALCEAHQDRQGAATAQHGLGQIARFQGDYAAARAHFAQTLAVKRDLNDLPGISASLVNLGLVAIEQGEMEAARELLAEGLAIDRQLGDRQGVATSLVNLGFIALHQQDYETAGAHFAEGLAIRQELGNRPGAAYAATGLGFVATARQDLAAASAHFRSALDTFREIGSKRGLAMALEGYARLAMASGRPRQAVTLRGAVGALREAARLSLPQPEERQQAEEQEQLRQDLGAEAYEAAWKAGRALSWEESAAYAVSEFP
ncbi:MAG TPA: tetratricopeptide repeat protein [Chthonomonadaceae bacterium]|nr:tetratricopeptide repeat protein [Chthonomonadaceae bacterium]